MRVKRDKDEGLLSSKRAEEVYGVLFDSTGDVDEDATLERRARLMSARLE